MLSFPIVLPVFVKEVTNCISKRHVSLHVTGFARVFLGPKLANVGRLLLPIIGTILAQALVWWFPVLIDVAGS